MLRKISHIILSALLLVSTMGFVVSKHYCEGKIVTVALFHSAASCGMNMDCCHNETSVYKVKEDFSTPQVAGLPNQAETNLFGFETLEGFYQEPGNTESDLFIYRITPQPPTTQKVLSLRQTYLL